MITSAFVFATYYLLNLIIQVFPLSAGFPVEVAAAFQYVGSYFQMLDPIVPVETFGTVVGILVSVELVILTYRIVEYIYSKVPIIGK